MTRPRLLLFLAAMALTASACSDRPKEGSATQSGASANVSFASDRITVTMRGSLQGQDIVLIHGLAAHSDVWSVVADSLAGRYRLHLVQIDGFAGAPPRANAEGPVLAPVADEIARYIQQLSRGPVAVVGHSMGGAIGMMIAARHPDVVGRLMVIDEPPALGPVFNVTPDSLQRMADAMRTGILAAPAGSVGPLEQMLPGMTRTAAARPRLLQYAHDSHRATVANAFHELFVMDLRPELGNVTALVTVLYALPESFPMSPEAFRKGMQQAFAPVKNVRLVRVDSSEHYIQIDQPARVVAEIRALMSASTAQPQS